VNPTGWNVRPKAGWVRNLLGVEVTGGSWEWSRGTWHDD
jgi:hypothetical protein